MARKKQPSLPVLAKDSDSKYATWLSTIEKTLTYYKNHWNGWDTWKLGYQLFRGDHWSNIPGLNSYPTSDNPREKITVNLVGSNVRTLLPFLINRRPKFIAKPRLIEHVEQAQYQEGILNYFWNEQGMQKQIERATMDAIIAGHGIVETGYDLGYERPENSKEDYEKVCYEDFVTEDSPYVRAISPFHFIWDPDAPTHDLDSARWCCKIFFKTFEDVKGNSNYSRSVIKSIERGEYDPETVSSFIHPRNTISDVVTSQRSTDYELVDNKRIVLYDLWDKKSSKHYIFIGNIPEPLVEESTPYPYLGAFPFIKLDFIMVPWEPFALGMPYGMLDQQLELNRIRTAMFAHRRRFNRKYEVVKNQLADSDQLNNLQTGEDGTLIMVKAKGTVGAIEDAKISTDQYNIEQVVKDDIKDITGLESLLRGGALPSRTSATEVNARTNFAGTKIDEYVSNIDNFVTAIGRQVLQHTQEYMQTSQVVQILGETGAEYRPVSPDDIKGEFVLTLETTSKPKTDPEFEKAQMMQLLGQLVQLAQLGVPVNFQMFGKILGEKFGIEGELILPGQALPMGGTGSPAGGTTPQGQMLGAAQPPQAAMQGAANGPAAAGMNGEAV